MEQLRGETSLRSMSSLISLSSFLSCVVHACVLLSVVDKVFPKGEKNKFWMQFSKKKFLNLNYQ